MSNLQGQSSTGLLLYLAGFCGLLALCYFKLLKKYSWNKVLKGLLIASSLLITTGLSVIVYDNLYLGWRVVVRCGQLVIISVVTLLAFVMVMLLVTKLVDRLITILEKVLSKPGQWVIDRAFSTKRRAGFSAMVIGLLGIAVQRACSLIMGRQHDGFAIKVASVLCLLLIVYGLIFLLMGIFGTNELSQTRQKT